MSPAARDGVPDERGHPLARGNAQLKRLRRLLTRRDERDAEAVIVLEGPTLIAEALGSDVRIEQVFHEAGAYADLAARARAAGVPVAEVGEGVLGPILSTVTPQPVVAVVNRVVADLDQVVADSLASHRPLLVLAGVSDPGNAGGLLRSAEAAGVAGVVFTRGSVDPFSPKVARASAGSVLRVPIVVDLEAAEALRVVGQAGVTRLGTAGTEGRPPGDVDLARPVALVLGSEAQGMAPALDEQLDDVVSIPMAGRTESLNVSVAGAVILFDAARQRRSDGLDDPGRAAAALISQAGHEIRSPLSAVKGFTKVLVDRWDRLDDGKKRTMLADVSTEADRLDRMVTEILDLSRVGSGRLRLDLRPVDLDRLVDGALAQVARDHPAADVEVDLADDLGSVTGDSVRLERVVVNLIENAVKYGEAVDVGVSGRRGDGVATLTVSDRGPGLTADELGSLFDQDRRISGGRPTGTGLGLWLGRAVAEAHGGLLTVASAPGEGTQVTLTLPAPEESR